MTRPHLDDRAVPSPLRRCIVHDTSFERVCNGCEADRKGVSA